MIRKNNKKFWRVLNNIKHLLILISAVTGHDSISTFGSLVGISLSITSSTLGLKICVITAGIKKYQ